MLRFCDFIRRRREELGFSMEQFAVYISMPLYHYKGIEEGTIKTPEQYLLQKIASGLQMSFEELRKKAEQKYF